MSVVYRVLATPIKKTMPKTISLELVCICRKLSFFHMVWRVIQLVEDVSSQFRSGGREEYQGKRLHLFHRERRESMIKEWLGPMSSSLLMIPGVVTTLG